MLFSDKKIRDRQNRSRTLPRMWSFSPLRNAGLQTVLHDGLVHDAAAVQALPAVEGYEVIGKPLRDHQPTAFRTFHFAFPLSLLNDVIIINLFIRSELPLSLYL